jgi:diaminopimelate decarboxylase
VRFEPFSVAKNDVFCEKVSLSRLAADFGTPFHVYSRNGLGSRCRELRAVFSSYPVTPCYAMKANSNLSLLREIFSEGFGADIVSEGELEKALVSGLAAKKIFFSGVGKRKEEIERAISEKIRSIHIESLDELELVARVAASRRQRTDIALRINPNIDAKTFSEVTTGVHRTKFGIAESDLEAAFKTLMKSRYLNWIGLACHLGSQITERSPFQAAAREMRRLASEIRQRGVALSYLDLGGGLGIRYRDEPELTFQDYASALLDEIRPTGLGLVVELGRSIVGPTAALVTQVLAVKKTGQKTFVIVDAGMTELIRPALYGAYHEIQPVNPSGSPTLSCDIVGPVCESTDFLGKDRRLAEVKPGDLLWVRDCGAYAASMASHYNSRPKAVEIWADGSRAEVIRARESLSALWGLEAAHLEKKVEAGSP